MFPDFGETVMQFHRKKMITDDAVVYYYAARVEFSVLRLHWLFQTSTALVPPQNMYSRCFTSVVTSNA